jgi:hypothetical protein
MKKFIVSILAFSPMLAFAQQLNDINAVAMKATNIGNLVVRLAISFAVIWIIISVVRYLIAGSDSEARAKGGQSILFGVIGLFAILSIWGLVYLLSNSFQFGQNNIPANQINNIQLPPPPIVP